MRKVRIKKFLDFVIYIKKTARPVIELIVDKNKNLITIPEHYQQQTCVCFQHILLHSELMRALIDNSSMKLNLSRGYNIKTNVNLLNIGTAQILTIPGEALPNIGFYLKRNMNTDQAFLFGLTNDAFGYIITKEDFNSFKRYDYISRTSLGEMTGEIFIQEALQLIQENPGATNY